MHESNQIPVPGPHPKPGPRQSPGGRGRVGRSGGTGQTRRGSTTRQQSTGGSGAHACRQCGWEGIGSPRGRWPVVGEAGGAWQGLGRQHRAGTRPPARGGWGTHTQRTGTRTSKCNTPRCGPGKAPGPQLHLLSGWKKGHTGVGALIRLGPGGGVWGGGGGCTGGWGQRCPTPWFGPSRAAPSPLAVAAPTPAPPSWQGIRRLEGSELIGAPRAPRVAAAPPGPTGRRGCRCAARGTWGRAARGLWIYFSSRGRLRGGRERQAGRLAAAAGVLLLTG